MIVYFKSLSLLSEEISGDNIEVDNIRSLNGIYQMFNGKKKSLILNCFFFYIDRETGSTYINLV